MGWGYGILSASVTSRSSGRNGELRTRVEPRANRFNGFYKTSAVPLGPTRSLAEGWKGDGMGAWIVVCKCHKP